MSDTATTTPVVDSTVNLDPTAQKRIVKMLAKKVALQVVVAAAVGVALHVIDQKLAEKKNV